MNISALKIFWGPALAAQVLLLALVAGAPGVMAQEQDPDHPGRKIYDDMCSQCHGGMGDAKSHGFEAMYPRPRDFTSGMFKFRRTGSGEYPLEKDLVQMITNGMPGTAMPPWGHVLKPDEIRLVAQYIQKFYASPDDEPLEEKKITKAPQATPELIRQGRQVFEKLECFRCHGQEGRGDGYNSMVLREDWNQEPIYPRNLTAGWLFRGGREPEDIYRTVLFGLNGTPMPAHSEEAALKEEQARWALAHYIRSISGSTQEPAVKSNIISKFTEGPVPVGGAHPVWEEAEVYYIPLAAQVVVEPRLYQPSVRQLWVQSLYNDYEIGLKVRWTDSTTQDNAAIKEALKKRETDEGLEPGSLQPPADEMSIQFPSNYEIGRTLPYFLMGRPGNSVNLWQFKS
ncbi:MAG: c-type cytochrome, partial [Deltaproteobacteria bacterium]|nr:c-type cytochrome [Deltaproteobacteria bacterium]